MLYVRIDAMSLDSTSVRVHPDACGALKKTAREPSDGHTTKIHLVAATARQAVIFCLSAGNEGDALRGRELLMRMGRIPEPCHLFMDHVYEGDETHELAQALGFIPVVPPSPNRKNPWDYDTIIYKRRNEVERLIRRVKSCRRVFTRYDKLDIMFLGFIVSAFIVEFLRLC